MRQARPAYRSAPRSSLLFGGQVSRLRDVRSGPPALSGIADAIWPASVLQWTPYLKRYGGSIPLPFLYAWLKKESGGNPCSYTTLRESGIFQLMPPDNTSRGGTSEAALRAACVGTSQAVGRTLTAAEADEQVRSGIQYVNYARNYARALVNWPESSPDFWRLVKMVHVAPARVSQHAPGTSSWTEFRRKAAANTPAHWLDNAEWVGGFGGGGISGTAMLVVAGLVAAGSLFYLRSRRRA